MRILQVTRVYWPHIGGIERHVQWLSEALVARGHSVDVLTLDRGFSDNAAYPAYEVLNGVRIYRVPFAGSTRYPLAPRARRCLGRADGPYDLVHVHAVDFLADWIALWKGHYRVPMVLSTHGGFFHTGFATPLKRLWFQTMTRALVRRVDRLLCTSVQDAALFARITDRGRLLTQAVDLAPWRGLARAPEPGRFLTVGRVDVHKGIAHLLRALAELRRRDPRPFRWVCAGPCVVEGLLEELRALAGSLGLADRVEFTGKVTLERLQSEVARADLALFPAEYESFGISVVEAMAAGLFPVLNRIPAFEAFLKGGAAGGAAGVIADFTDPVAAAAAIASARDRLEADRGGLEAAARAVAAGYDWARVVAEVEEVYRELLPG